MSRLVAYVRMSTDSQSASPETQRQVIADWCAAHGHTLVHIYEELATSGGKKGIHRRPVLAELVAAVKNPRRDFDGLVVYKLDRLAREPGTEYAILGELDAHKCVIHSCTESIDRQTAQGRFLFHTMMGVRALEREMAGERVLDHNLTRLKQGLFPGGQVPLGYGIDPATGQVILTDRAEDARRVFAEFVAQNGNAQGTAKALNRMGMVGKHGKPFEGGAVRKIIRAAAYRRALVYSGEEVPAPDMIPECVPLDLVDQARLLIQTAKSRHPRVLGSQYGYSGVLYCSECGNPMKAHVGSTVGWLCNQRPKGLCQGRHIAQKYLDKLVGMLLRDLLVNADPETAVAADEAADPEAHRGTELERLRAVRQRVWDAWIDGGISKGERDRRLADIDRQIERLTPEAERTPLTVEEVRQFLDVLDAQWSKQPEDLRRRLLLLLEARIIVNTGERPIWVRMTTNLTAEEQHAILPPSYPHKHRQPFRGLSTEHL